MKADLHSHSRYSDGKYEIYDLLKYAKERGIDWIALTDHDTVFGNDELTKYSELIDVKVVKGIELSCEYKGTSIHVVGLFRNNYVPDFMYDLSKKLGDKRQARAIIMAERIKEIYDVNIYTDLLVKENKTITRKNILDHILKYNDIDINIAKAFISKKSLAYIPSEKYDVIDGLNLLHNNNALCILAHPCLIEDTKLIEELVKLPFDGIEVKYANEKNDYEYFKKLALNNKLFMSAGSDFHGDSSHGDIGDVYLEDEEVFQVLDMLGLK